MYKLTIVDASEMKFKRFTEFTIDLNDVNDEDTAIEAANKLSMMLKKEYLVAISRVDVHTVGYCVQMD